ncbi:MAG TPA: folate-binding protein [Opitutaceae bacterium]|nr:folate-binding protein [Opitutaceae bacterium]
MYCWQPGAWLHVAGADAINFLQGQFTNDLRALPAAAGVYGLWLDQKGHALADSFVLSAGASAFWVGSYFSAANALRQRLEAYIIADDVMVEDETTAWAGISLIGADAEGAAAKIPKALCFSGRRAAAPAVEVILPAKACPAAEAWLEAAGWPRLSAEDMEQLRITAGIAAVPRDIGPTDLPNEGGLETAAISYTKGCYLGQEVMARLKSMGRVRRRLLRVAGEGRLPALPAPLFQGEKKVGELRSGARQGEGFIGLALLTLLGLAPDTGLSFAPGAGLAVHLADPDALTKN